MLEIRALSWNLFHGRDAPPEPGLSTWRSRLLRITERGQAHAQVNRDLLERFADLLAAAEWDVALLQECPPRWAERLATRCHADPHLVPTSRNLARLAWAQNRFADWNPDLLASWEGGSNLTLVRDADLPGAVIVERGSIRLALTPERRRMALTRLASGVCIANLHASAERAAAELELPRAARLATDFAAGEPLIFGGDLNLRPGLSPHIFDTIAREQGLRAPTGPRAIDHLLVAGAEILEPAEPWAPERREVPDPTCSGTDPLPIRLSDHAPVAARFGIAAGAHG